MRDAGADALELNLYSVATDPRVGAAELEARYLDLVADVRAAVSIPLAVKLSPFFTALANFAVRTEEAGADGLVLFNRFYQPDLDLDSNAVPRLVLSTSEELRRRCAGSPSCSAASGSRWPPPPGSTPGWTRPRCCWPGRTWP